jgi:ring-1,2-phenylacetyl-CoA epoxidase subunit PaaE
LFSNYANQKAEKRGMLLAVATPKGRFTYEPKKNRSKTIVAFAAGSGITPIMSIVKNCFRRINRSKMYSLLWQ